jgi:cobaltochelatase CobN
VENAQLALRFAAHLIGRGELPPPARPMPSAGFWRGEPAIDGRPNAIVIFYRALVAGGDTAGSMRCARRWTRAGSTRSASMSPASRRSARRRSCARRWRLIRPISSSTRRLLPPRPRMTMPACCRHRAVRSCRWRRPGFRARTGKARPGVSRRAIWRCMWCCRKSTAASSPTPSPSRSAANPRRLCADHFRPVDDRVAATADLARAWVRLRRTPAISGVSPSCSPIIRAAMAASATASASIRRKAWSRCSARCAARATH